MDKLEKIIQEIEEILWPDWYKGSEPRKDFDRRIVQRAEQLLEDIDMAMEDKSLSREDVILLTYHIKKEAEQVLRTLRSHQRDVDRKYQQKKKDVYDLIEEHGVMDKKETMKVLRRDPYKQYALWMLENEKKIKGIGGFYHKASLSSLIGRIYTASIAHKKSIALMRFLSEQAKRMGVARHTYVVGGAVRNFLIDQPIKDIDVVIDSVATRGKDSEWFAKQLQRNIPAKTTLTTNQYGVAILSVSEEWILDGVDLQGEVIEIANARKESYGGGAGKGYKPHHVEPATIEEDIYRRELNFNTLLWSLADLASGPDKAKIIDITGCGVRDLKDNIMRCPSDPDKTFSDDPTRMLRIVKFFVKYRFKIHKTVSDAIKRNVKKIHNAPSDAIAKILINDILQVSQVKTTLKVMDDLGIIKEIAAMAKKDRAFRNTLANWASRDANILFLFEMMDMGLPVRGRIGFLDGAQEALLRQVALHMSDKEALQFVDLLKQPTKMVNTKKLMEDFDLQGPDMKKVMDVSRDILLQNPQLKDNARRFEQSLRKELR